MEWKCSPVMSTYSERNPDCRGQWHYFLFFFIIEITQVNLDFNCFYRNIFKQLNTFVSVSITHYRIHFLLCKKKKKTGINLEILNEHMIIIGICRNFLQYKLHGKMISRSTDIANWSYNANSNCKGQPFYLLKQRSLLDK